MRSVLGRGDRRLHDALFREAFDLADEVSPVVLLRRVVNLAAGVAEADHSFLVVIDGNGEVQNVITSGDEEEGRRLDRATADRGVVGRILREGRTIRLDGLGDDPSVVGFPRDAASGPFLGLPISLWGRVFGAVCLGRRDRARPFDHDDEEEMALVGAQAGVALDHARLLLEGRVRERALVAVKEVSQAILDGRDTDDVLQLIAGWARTLVCASFASVATPEPSGDALLQRVADGDRAAEVVGMVFPAAGSISGDVMRTRQPVSVADASCDPRTSQPVVQLGGMGPALFVPLAIGERVFGTLAVANASGGSHFTPEDLLLVQTFAAEAAVALQYGQIREELERLSLIEERERIAMDLHDGVIQALFVVGLSLQGAQAVVHDPEEVAVRLGDAVGSIDRAIRDLRDYIFGLQPGELPDDQLERSLREVAVVFQRASHLSISVDIDRAAASMLSIRSTDVVHAAREAVSNAVRHSGGDKLTLRLRVDNREAVLEVIDNGSGFDPHGVTGRGHGLPNLRSRADALGGTLQIETEPGNGAAVRIRVPV